MLKTTYVSSTIEASDITHNVNIDFSFIYQLEGGSLLTGYVPDAANSQSGVTIATGFDLGARNAQDLRSLALNPTLIGKLYPYLGLKGLEALSYSEKFPLHISENEAAAIDSGVKMQMIKKLCKRYDKSSEQAFSSLPACWQTVIASVEFQYGNLQQRCPSFWSFVIKQNWQRALEELRNFGDRYTTRRNREADYIEQHLPV